MVQSVQRAFKILKMVADHPEKITIREMAETLGVHQSTVSRLIATLEIEGAIERVGDCNQFRIGSGIEQLTCIQLPTNDYVTNFNFR